MRQKDRLDTLATSIRSYVENNGPCKIDEIAEDTFITKSSVIKYLNQLVAYGEINPPINETYQ